MARGLAAGKSDQGRIRKTNDDAFRLYHEEVADTGRGFLFAVADGIGSYRAGGQAAWMAVDQLSLYFRLPREMFEGQKTLEDLVFKANDAITALRTQQQGYYGMGCTLTALLVDPRFSLGLLYHAGDSMAYLLRRRRLVPITTPHKDGEGLSNHLGLGDKLRLDRARVQLEIGDAILLCTDGISGFLEPPALEMLMAEHSDPKAAVDAIVAAAVQAGDDNCTAIVLRVTA
ncbi:MAG: serine/threonine-protein phosphatase [Deltaproteobacteria bacterium]|nr:serine/threonine-protein phosphatase [Deltaproteobacteria bacterium]